LNGRWQAITQYLCAFSGKNAWKGAWILRERIYAAAHALRLRKASSEDGADKPANRANLSAA
jgi:hypothetical protein